MLALAFLATSVAPPVHAQGIADLPVPGTMVPASSAYVPVLLKGMIVHPEDPYRFDFIVDSGNSPAAFPVKDEAARLVRYFLASMTMAQKDIWVNLSPAEKDRIIPDALGKTELGQDLLAQDYVLKQLTATFMHPEGDLGREFWGRVYAQAQEKYGTVDIPTDAFHKVWITPDTATVYEKDATVYVVKARLKVMLETDYHASVGEDLVSSRQDGPTEGQPLRSDPEDDLVKDLMRSIILPAIENEVNTGRNFAPLRQIYHSLILAKWYKQKITDSILSKVYVDQARVKGVDLASPTMKQDIYARYVQAYKKGVYNYIKEEYDPLAGETVPRKYFAGGFEDAAMAFDHADSAEEVAGAHTGSLQVMRVMMGAQTVDEDEPVVMPDGRVRFNGFLVHSNLREALELFRKAGLKEGGRVLEVGPNLTPVGTVALAFPDTRLVLVDPARVPVLHAVDMYARAIKREGGGNLGESLDISGASPRVGYVNKTIEEAALSDLKGQKFDVITFINSLDMKNWTIEPMLRAALPLLNDNGALIVRFHVEEFFRDRRLVSGYEIIKDLALSEFGLEVTQDPDDPRILRVKRIKSEFSDEAQMTFEELPEIALTRFPGMNIVSDPTGTIPLHGYVKDGEDERIIFFFSGASAQTQKEMVLKEILNIRQNESFPDLKPLLPELGKGFVRKDDLTVIGEVTGVNEADEYVVMQRFSKQHDDAIFEFLKGNVSQDPLELDKQIMDYMRLLTDWGLLASYARISYRDEHARLIEAAAMRHGSDMLGSSSLIKDKLSHLRSYIADRFNPGADFQEKEAYMKRLYWRPLTIYLQEVYYNINIKYQTRKIINRWGVQGGVEGIKELEQYFDYKRYPDPRFRMAALQAIGIINSHKGIPLLIKGLKGVKGVRLPWAQEERETKQIQERFVRKLAAQLLGQLKDIRSNTPLVEALSDPDERIFDEALASLVRIGGEDTVRRLNAARSKEPRTRMSEIYDDHSLMALYTKVPRNMKGALGSRGGINTDNLKYVKSVELENARIQKISQAIDILIRKNAEFRDSVRIDLDKIVDKRMAAFMAWLRAEGLDKDFVLVGGGVRDAFTGEMANDFDINVIVPLTDEEKQRGLTFSNQATPETYQYCMDKLKLLAEKLGADVDQFIPPVKGKKPVVWSGVVDGQNVEVEVQYTGPIKLFDKKEKSPVYLMRSIVSQEGQIFLSQAGASILTLGMDAYGRVYGSANALAYFDEGLVVLAGSPQYLSLGAVLRFLRVKHQYDKKILKQNYQQLSNYVKKYLSGKLKMQGVMKLILLEQTKKVLRTARNPQAAFEEFKELGIIELIQREWGENITSIEDVENIENIGGGRWILQPYRLQKRLFWMPVCLIASISLMGFCLRIRQPWQRTAVST